MKNKGIKIVKELTQFSKKYDLKNASFMVMGFTIEELKETKKHFKTSVINSRPSYKVFNIIDKNKNHIDLFN